MGADEDGGDVVSSAGGVGSVDELMAELRKGSAAAEDGGDAIFIELAGEAVGTEQKRISGFKREFGDFGFDGALRADSAGDDVAERGAVGVLLGHVPEAHLFFDK